MQGLAILIGLGVIGYGFGEAGLHGALTGLVASLGTISGFSILSAGSETGVHASGPKRAAQRFGGLVAALACLGGAIYGGWRFGWAWGLAGYASGIVVAIIAALILTKFAHSSVERPLLDMRSKTFDLDDILDVTLLEEIRERYGAHMSDETHPYARCLFRPTTMLPYPQEVIRSALPALLDFVEGRRSSAFLDASSRQPEVAETVKVALVMLDHYIDLPPDQLATDPSRNADVGFAFSRAGESRSP